MRAFEGFPRLWPGRDHLWAERLNAMPKYVFSSTLESATWANSTIVRGDVCSHVRQLKEQSGGNLLIYGPGLLAEALLKHQHATLRLVGAKAFAKDIVKLTYEPDYAGDQVG
jgi:dihydrofolate reductase